MADQQQVTTGAPAVDVPTTPEAAREQLEQLNADEAWVKARIENGPKSKEANQEDALLRILAGAPSNPVAAPAVVATMTAEQAAARLEESKADPAWRQARIKGGNKSAQAKEEDVLLRIVASGVGSTTAEQLTESGKPKTAAERLKMLDRVPQNPEDYEVDWRAVSPSDPVPEKGIKAIKSWARELGLTHSEMTTVTHFAGKDVERYQKMDPAQREEHAVQVIKDFGKRHGAAAASLYDGACKLAEEMSAKDPQFKRFLEADWHLGLAGGTGRLRGGCAPTLRPRIMKNFLSSADGRKEPLERDERLTSRRVEPVGTPKRKKSKRRTGRTPKLTVGVGRTIVAAIEAGNFPSVAAQLAGTDLVTLENWLKRGDRGDQLYADFAEAFRRAEAEGESGRLRSGKSRTR